MDNALPELLGDRSALVGIPSLVPRDDPRLDPSPIARLFAHKGEAGAELVIGKALDELAERVSRAASLHATCQFNDLSRLARSVVAVAEEIGFQGVALAAAQVSQCAMTRDPIALAATMARLTRLTEQSLAAVWDLDPGSPLEPVGF